MRFLCSLLSSWTIWTHSYQVKTNSLSVKTGPSICFSCGHIKLAEDHLMISEQLLRISKVSLFPFPALNDTKKLSSVFLWNWNLDKTTQGSRSPEFRQLQQQKKEIIEHLQRCQKETQNWVQWFVGELLLPVAVDSFRVYKCQPTSHVFPESLFQIALLRKTYKNHHLQNFYHSHSSSLTNINIYIK